MIPKKMVEGVKGTRKHTIECQWCQEVDEGMPRVSKMHTGGMLWQPRSTSKVLNKFLFWAWGRSLEDDNGTKKHVEGDYFFK